MPPLQVAFRQKFCFHCNCSPKPAHLSIGSAAFVHISAPLGHQGEQSAAQPLTEGIARAAAGRRGLPLPPHPVPLKAPTERQSNRRFKMNIHVNIHPPFQHYIIAFHIPIVNRSTLLLLASVEIGRITANFCSFIDFFAKSKKKKKKIRLFSFSGKK